MTGFTVSEPHPTVTKGAYMHSGRGGAGNYFRAPATTPSTGVAMTVSASHSTNASSASRRFFSGRGGAGNAHVATEAPLLNLEEEYNRLKTHEESGVGHVGRGGAGNFYSSSDKSTSSAASSTRRSSGDSNGNRSSFWARLSHSSVHE